MSLTLPLSGAGKTEMPREHLEPAWADCDLRLAQVLVVLGVPSEEGVHFIGQLGACCRDVLGELRALRRVLLSRSEPLVRDDPRQLRHLFSQGGEDLELNWKQGGLVLEGNRALDALVVAGRGERQEGDEDVRLPIGCLAELVGDPAERRVAKCAWIERLRKTEPTFEITA
jgi:hypothetical protein